MKVFIAYKREDDLRNSWVEKLATDLINRHGVECLIDVFSHSRTVPQFSQRIDECDIAIVIVTHACLQSLLSGNGYVSYEVDLAISLNVAGRLKIIPILREGEKMAFSLSPYPYIDFTNDGFYNNSLLELLSFMNLQSGGKKAAKKNLLRSQQSKATLGLEAAYSENNNTDEALNLNIGFETVLNLWEQSTNGLNIDTFAEGILKLSEPNVLSKQFSNTIMLEGLYNTFSIKNTTKSLNSPFNKIASLRAGVYTRVLLLKRDIADETCEGLVNSVTDNMPNDGFASALKYINKIVPCKNMSRLYWAAIINWALCSNTLPDELPDNYNLLRNYKVAKYSPVTPEGYKIIIDGLLSELSIARIHALLRLINWAAGLTVEPYEATNRFNYIQDIVIKLACSGNLAEKLIALIATRFFVEKPKGLVDGRRIQSEHYLPLLSLLIDQSNKPILEDIILTIGRIFQTYCDYRESRNWLFGKNSDHLFNLPVNITNITAPIGLADRLKKMLSIQDNPKNKVTQMLSLALLRLGLWINNMTEPLKYLLQEVAIAKTTMQEIIIRITKLNEPNSKLLLRSIIDISSSEFPSDLKFLAFIALLQTGQVALLMTIKDTKPFLDDIDINEAISESKELTPEGYWNGPVADYLRNKLYKNHLSNSGHLIHKLKAKDTTGRWAYYFVFVEPENEVDFLAVLEGDGTIDLENFGKVVASCYGEMPSDEVKVYLNEKYGFNV